MNREYAELLTNEDTIVSVSTPPGRGAVAVVRLSGRNSFETARACLSFSGRSERTLEPRHMTMAFLADGTEQIDEVLVCFFPAPGSYTGEDLVEIYPHGNPVIVARSLEALIAKGARPAEPGEFTLRAFRSGRIDLSQAEAVNDLINAETDSARRLALRSLRGGLAEKVLRVRKNLDELLIHIETDLEFESEEADTNSGALMSTVLTECLDTCTGLWFACERQQSHTHGLILTICGKPNVGKSSLLNRILERERALVSHIPGTTRDTIEERFEIGGMPFLCIDTAGIREAKDEIESLGIQRTNSAIEQADAVLFLVDLAGGVDKADADLLARVKDSVGEKTFFFLANKKDLLPEEEIQRRLRELETTLGAPSFIPVSAKTGEGIQDLLTRLHGWASKSELMTGGVEVYINTRQGRILKEVAGLLESANEGRQTGVTLDRIADDLHHARRLLARLLGEETPPDLLDEIFSRFCIGK